jgi:hypothetical protein
MGEMKLKGTTSLLPKFHGASSLSGHFRRKMGVPRLLSG